MCYAPISNLKNVSCLECQNLISWEYCFMFCVLNFTVHNFLFSRHVPFLAFVYIIKLYYYQLEHNNESLAYPSVQIRPHKTVQA